MKYFHLIWAALFRSKTRTLLTLFSVIAAFLLFGMLDSVRVAFTSGGNSVAGADRLIVSSKLSLTQMLPVSLARQVETSPGVKQSTFAAWFGGIYQDPNQFFPNFSVGKNFFDLYPEYVIPEDQLAACRRIAPALWSVPRWPSGMAGRSATRFLCRRRSSRARAATTGR